MHGQINLCCTRPITFNKFMGLVYVNEMVKVLNLEGFLPSKAANQPSALLLHCMAKVFETAISADLGCGVGYDVLLCLSFGTSKM